MRHHAYLGAHACINSVAPRKLQKLCKHKLSKSTEQTKKQTLCPHTLPTWAVPSNWYTRASFLCSSSEMCSHSRLALASCCDNELQLWRSCGVRVGKGSKCKRSVQPVALHYLLCTRCVHKKWAEELRCSYSSEIGVSSSQYCSADSGCPRNRWAMWKKGAEKLVGSILNDQTWKAMSQRSRYLFTYLIRPCTNNKVSLHHCWSKKNQTLHYGGTYIQGHKPHKGRRMRSHPHPHTHWY